MRPLFKYVIQLKRCFFLFQLNRTYSFLSEQLLAGP